MKAPFRNRDFVRLFAGRVITNAGDSLYFIAAMWLVYDLTGDPFYSGVAGFLTLAPSGLQAFFGPLVDRWDLRRLLVRTQVVQGVVILSLPVAHVLGMLSAPLILVVMPVLSTLNQFVYPAQTAALPRIVEDEELVEANSAFALAYQGIDSVFNAVAGVLIAIIGAVTLFVVDSVTFLAAALLFATLTIPAAEEASEPEAGETSVDQGTSGDGGDPDAVPVTDGGEGGENGEDDEDGGYLVDLKEGVQYLRGTFLAVFMGGSLVINFTLGTMNSTMPAYADGIGGPEAYGILLAALSIGVFVGAAVASWFERFPFGHLSIAGFLFSGVVWVAAIWIGWLPATAVLLALAGVPVGTTNVLLNSLVQAVTPDRLLGRVSAVLGSVSSFMIPFGALAGGTAASTFGPVPVMFVAGVGFLFLGAYVFAFPTLRGLPTITAMDTLTAGSEHSGDDVSIA
jgi:MFS family permease